MRRTGRIGLVFAIAATSLFHLASPPAAAVSTDCSISGGQFCLATFTAIGSRENWSVPTGITSITVDVQGAAGGDGASLGGRGARMQATLTVTPGSVLEITVGNKGSAGAFSSNTSYSGGVSMRVGGGGGGGSFIIGPSTTPFVIAGGGGGGQGPCCYSSSADYASKPGLDATTTRTGTAGSNAASTAFGPLGTESYGGGTTTTNGAGGGGGWLGNGGFGSSSGIQGRGYTNGSVIAPASSNDAGWGIGGAGGFGGGGAAYGGAGGGGGGYTGGGGGGGSSNWGAGGGGGSFLAAGTTSTTSTAGHQTGNGAITIRYLNAPVVTSFTSAQSALTNTTSGINYSLSFSQIVNTVSGSDFSNAGTATGCIFSVNTASSASFTLTASSCGNGTLTPQVIANSVFGTVTNTAGPSANSLASTTITIDRTAPTIPGTLNGPADATYIPTQSLTFTAPFSETVTVTDTPRLALTIGSTTRYANYVSGTNTRTLTFTYVVQTALADIDTDGIVLTTSLELNGGTIRDLATNALSNFSFTAPTLTSVLVAQRPAAPMIDSITATSGQLAIAFTAGASNGSAITNYEFSTNNGLNWTTRNPVATTSPLTITGLANGQAYSVRLRAINAAGTGESSTAVSATPTAVVVGGGSNITITYGQAASSSAFSATGGTGVYTYSLSATPSGVSISGSTVTASATTPAGTYTQNVIATDNGGSPQSGTKTITIIIAKAATSITIALPNSASSAALGGAVTITATVPRAGAVNFRLGGTTLTGCGTAAAASTTATCSWVPTSLGSVGLTAVFTPTDTSNFETSTTTTLTITVVNGVSTVTLSLTGGVTQVPKGQAINIVAAIDQIGRVTFLIDGKRLPGCFNVLASAIGNRNCSWKPTVQKAVNITARLVPTNSVFNPSVSNLSVQVVRRSGTR